MMRLVRWARALPASQVWLILAAMLLSGPAGFTACWWWLHQPPVISMDVYEDDEVAVSGGELVLIARKVENASCLTRVARWLWRLDPTDPLPDDAPRKRRQWRELTSTPHSPPTLVGHAADFRLMIPLPTGIEPGDWHYQGQALDSCRGPLRDGPRYSRDIPVHIIAEGTPP